MTSEAAGFPAAIIAGYTTRSYSTLLHDRIDIWTLKILIQQFQRFSYKDDKDLWWNQPKLSLAPVHLYTVS